MICETTQQDIDGKRIALRRLIEASTAGPAVGFAGVILTPAGDGFNTEIVGFAKPDGYLFAAATLLDLARRQYAARGDAQAAAGLQDALDALPITYEHWMPEVAN